MSTPDAPETRPGWALLPEFARLLLLAVVLPVLMLATLLLWRGVATAQQQAAARLAVAAEVNGRQIDAFLQSHLVALQVLAERRGAAGDIDDVAAWSSDLRHLRRHYPAFVSLLATDGAGVLRTTAPAMAATTGAYSVADRDYFREPRRSGRGHVSNAFRGRALGTDPLVAVSVPLHAEKGFAGVLEGSIPIEALAPSQRWLRKRGLELLLLDRNLSVVQASPGLPYRPLDTLRGDERKRWLAALPTADGRARMQRLPGVLRDGGDAYALAMPLEVGWSLWLLQPEQAVEAELWRNAMIMLGLLALVLLGVLAIVGIKMRRLGGSVRGLLERMQHFAVDREPEPIAAGSLPRELAPLADAMNRLADDARTAYGQASSGMREQSLLREELQAMAQRLLTAQEDERRALSRELHDDVGQSITAIKLGATALLDDDPARREIVDEIVAIADHTVLKLRNLSLLLRPPQLDSLGLEAALRGQVALLERNTRTKITLRVPAMPQRPPPAVELACFRIAQEALTNALRHARATTIEVVIELDGQALHLRVEDDGRGVDPADVHGLGLLTMRERAQQLGGSLVIDSAPGRGTRVRATLPIAPHDADPAKR
ncbi:ATP-binding protein [Luteimonas notoginsengisoli]|jgi:signal transduction histidine kinase|uniref:Oxygen sensor histidine kinase NreB n=1 Tax=Luteimonas notoginsengisoli TaxID=1578200 RepID=A0ABV7UXY4_9GAMM